MRSIINLFLPLSQQKKLPVTISSFCMDDNQISTYVELVDRACSVSSYKITDEKILNLEQAIQLQSKCKLWSIHRAGTTTAGNLKSAVRTDPCKPSVSLVKRLCYPEQRAIQSSVLSTAACYPQQRAIHSSVLSTAACYPQQHAFSTSTTRWDCEHEATAVEEFLD